jgi:eukaryotic-like serine/threonine-protein kinase
VHFSHGAQAKSAPWLIGSVIGGRYRLRGRLAAGGMGEIWKAEHLTLGTTAAVKLVDTADRDNPHEILARFQLEARAAAQLRSPHVVQILDHGVDGHVAFMVMELLEGESLEGRLERRGKLPPDEVAYILSEVCLAMEQAHAAGVIHRDLKPSNIFLARQPDGRIVTKVLDFGIAKVLKTPRESRFQTQAGVVVGTPSYMSPEQVLGKPLDARSDLWALSVIAFECIAGQRLINGETLGEIFLQICAAPLPAPSTLGTVPPSFNAWFERATARDPERRFQTATEFAAALRSSLEPGSSRGMPWPSSAKAPPRSGVTWTRILSVVSLLVITSAIGIYWMMRSSHPPVVTPNVTPAWPAASADPPVSDSKSGPPRPQGGQE